jgi:tetratricopeptide (TPR) repeat protein
MVAYSMSRSDLMKLCTCTLLACATFIVVGCNAEKTAVQSNSKQNSKKTASLKNSEEGSVEKPKYVSPEDKLSYAKEFKHARKEFKIGNYRAAIDVFTSAIAYQDTAEARFFRAISYLCLSEADAAFGDLDAIESQWPGSVEALMARAWNIQLSTGQGEKAVKLADEAIAREPKNAWCYFVRSNADRRDLKKRREFAEKALALAPDEARIIEQLGNICLSLFDYSTASQCFSKVLSVNPHAAACLTYLGHTRLLQGKSTEAESLLRKSLQEDPRLEPACPVLSWVYRHCHKKKECFAFWENAPEEIKKNPVFYLHESGSYLQWGENRQALKFINKFLEKSRIIRFTRDELLGAYIVKHDALAALGDRQGAFDCAVTAKTLAPNDAAALNIYLASLKQLQRYKTVLAEVDSALAAKDITAGERVNWMLVKADVYRLTGQQAAARALSEQALKLAPKDTTALALIGYSLSADRKFSEALPWFIKAEKLGRDPFEMKSAIADNALAAKKLDLAVKYSNEIVRDFPDVGHGWMVRAKVFHQLEQQDKMRADLKKALASGDLGPGDYNLIGNMYFNVGDTDAAADAFLQEALLDSRGQDARRKIGAFCRIIAPDLILAKASQMVARNERDARAHSVLALCKIALKDNNGGMNELNKAIELEPNTASFYSDRGFLFFEFGEVQEALADFDKAIDKIGLETSLAYRGRGLVLMACGKTREAIKDFNKAIELGPEAYDAPYVERGTCYRRLREFDKAVADMEKARKYQTIETFLVRKRSAELYAELNQNDKALALYTEALSFNPNDLQCLESRADVLAKMEKYNEAIKAYDAVVKCNINATGAYYKRAKVFRKLGKTDLAAADEAKAKSIDQYMLGPEKRR